MAVSPETEVLAGQPLALNLKSEPGSDIVQSDDRNRKSIKSDQECYINTFANKKTLKNREKMWYKSSSNVTQL